MDKFFLRRAIERLRDGLFDSTAISRLTIEEDRIKNTFSKGLKALKKGESDHLCICGSYGQGKSHTITYLNQLALSQGYATSMVQLDLREVPFHQFPIVYQSIMENLSLPDGKKFIHAWKKWAEKERLSILDTMPHRFKIILKAMLCKNKQLSVKEISLKKHQNYKPKEYGYWLEKALMGQNVPIASLQSVFKYREVEGYRDQPLSCRGNEPFFEMIQSLGELLKQMGYQGLLLFFDEAESISQMRLGNRAKSYQLLDQFFQKKSYVFPVFAFTNDFFEKVNQEKYEQDDKNLFSKNYANTWRNLNILRLQEFSAREWKSLLERLILLYSEAYEIDSAPELKVGLQSLLAKLEGQETRCKLKALVNKLDVQTQQVFLGT